MSPSPGFEPSTSRTPGEHSTTELPLPVVVVAVVVVVVFTIVY